MTNLIKINNKYTNNKLIYLDKDTYKIIKSLTKDIKKVFNDEIIITGGYKTLFIIKRNSYHQLYNSGKAFNLLIKNKEILNYINDNLTRYGLVKEDNFYYYIGKASYLINKYHLTIEGYQKMFE